MNAFILMTRVPIPGKTKTRLMEVLTGEECAEIHCKFLLDLFNICSSLRDNTDIYLTYTPEGCISYIEDIIPDFINVFPQVGEDLGSRMRNAINKLFYKNYNKVVLIGSDIPEVQPYNIRRAFEILEDKDMCFGPTEDGGYYLIGMKKPHDAIFCNDIVWGKKSVLEGTIDIANRKGISVGLSPKCCDIDTKEDILKFIKKAKDKESNWEVFPGNTVKYIYDLSSKKPKLKQVRANF